MRRWHQSTTHGSGRGLASYDLTTVKLLDEVAEVTRMTMPAVGLRTPVIAIISVGEDMAATQFREALEHAGEYAGVTINSCQLEKTVSDNAVAKCLASFSRDEGCHGIILQLPLPEHIDALTLSDHVEPNKDVDCISLNSFKAYLRAKHDFESESPSAMIPCLPNACEALLLSTGRKPAQCRVLLLAIPLVLSEPLRISLQIAGYDVAVCAANEPAGSARSHCKKAEVVIVGKRRSDCVAAQWIRTGCLIMDLGLSLGSSPPSPVLPRPAALQQDRQQTVTCLCSGDGLAQRVAALRLSNACQAALLQQGFLEETTTGSTSRQGASSSEPSARSPASPAASSSPRARRPRKGAASGERRLSTHVFEYAFD